MEKELYWIWFSMLQNMSSGVKSELIGFYGDAEAIYYCDDYSLMPHLSHKDKKILENKNLENAKQIFADTKRLGQMVIAFDSEFYPSELRSSSNPPYVLYARGKFPDWDSHLAISIIGTRNCTSYGLSATKHLTQELAGLGVIIVSGMARGIDTAAATECMNADGFTVAVLGSGLDVVYPSENADLMEEIASSGLLISEFPPGTPPLPHHFPMRNRIISGISKGVLVIESSRKGGSLITAKIAYDEFKDVFAVPGSIFSNASDGTNRIISKGQAKAVMCVNDILEEYAHLYSFVPAKTDESKEKQDVRLPDEITEKLSDVEQKIVKLLIGGSLHADILARETGLSAPELTSTLAMLEFSGYIKKESGNNYKLNI